MHSPFDKLPETEKHVRDLENKLKLRVTTRWHGATCHKPRLPHFTCARLLTKQCGIRFNTNARVGPKSAENVRGESKKQESHLGAIASYTHE
jgi:hypothetical protein